MNLLAEGEKGKTTVIKFFNNLKMLIGQLGTHDAYYLHEKKVREFRFSKRS